MRTTVLRVGLFVLAIPQAMTGVWAWFAPSNWFDHFPGLGHAWVVTEGPYNEHLTRDVGAAFLGLGVLLIYAAIRAESGLVRAALTAWLVYAVLHLVFHLSHADNLPRADHIASLASLAGSVVLPLALLPLTRHRLSTAQPGTAMASTTHVSPLTGGTTNHGTD